MHTESSTAPVPDNGPHIVVESQTLTLRRYYVIAGWVTILMLVLVLALVYRIAAISDLIYEHDEQTRTLATQLTNTAWPDFRVSDDYNAEIDEVALREYVQSTAFEQTILDLIEGMPVVRVRFYTTDGLILFSTLADEIDQYATDDAVIEHISRSTYYYSWRQIEGVLTYAESFDTPDGTLEKRNLIASTASLRHQDSRQRDGILQIHQDVTAPVQDIVRNQALGMGGIMLLTTVLCGWLLFRLYRSAQTRKDQGNAS